MLSPGGHEQTLGQCNGLHRGAKAKGCELAVRPGQRWALTSRLEAISRSSGHCGSPGFPTSSQCRVSPGRRWALFSGRRSIHPGGRVLRRSSQSLRLQSKGRREVSGALGRGWRPVGWTPEGPVLLHLTALGLHPSSLCPHQWSALSLPTVPGPGAAPPGDSVGEGRPPWDPSPPETEQLQKLVPLFRKFPSFPRKP